MTNSDLNLSEDQSAAVNSEANALVVVAPAGSGKTEVLARRIERILVGSSEEDYRIAALSYTVKAADELKNRLKSRLGEIHRRVDADTTHGFALSLLRSYGTRVGLPAEPEILTRDEDRIELLNAWLTDSGYDLPEDPREVFRDMDLARARMTSAPFIDEWRQALSANGAVDYTGMIERANELTAEGWVPTHLRRLYGHFAIDEAQNLSQLQYRFLCNLVGRPGSEIPATLVGDERQSIVGFAGADATVMQQFADTYRAKRVELKTNYRSADLIVRVGNRIAAELGRNDLPAERVYPARGSVELLQLDDETSEAAAVAHWAEVLLNEGLPAANLSAGEKGRVAPEDIAILARSAASLRLIRTALDYRNIQAAQASTEDDWVTSTAGRLVVALVAYLSSPSHQSTRRLLTSLGGEVVGPSDDPFDKLAIADDSDVRAMSALSTAATPDQLIEALLELTIDDPNWLNDLDQLRDAYAGFVDRYGPSERSFGNFNQSLARARRGDALSDGVRLLTIHRAQGREYKAVAVVACNEGQLPDFRARSAEDRQAELRVFYVATSRASRALLLTRAVRRRTRFGSRLTDRSTFVDIALSALSP